MTHANEFESSGTSPSDFTLRDEGSILLLTPHTEAARSWRAIGILAANYICWEFLPDSWTPLVAAFGVIWLLGIWAIRGTVVWEL